MVSVEAGIGIGGGYVADEEQIGDTYVTDSYEKVGDSRVPLYCCGGLLGFFGLGCIYSYLAGMKSDVHVTATLHHWKLEVHTEMFKVVRQGDWQRNIPDDSYNRMCTVKQSGTHKDLIDRICHDEEGEEAQSRCETNNGVRHCKTYHTPVVRHICNNVYQYYIDYDMWCEYDANRWVPQPPAVSEGTGLAPYWPYAEITNCGMFHCTRLSDTEQHYVVNFHIDDGHGEGKNDICDFSDPKWNIQEPQKMWGWIKDEAQYQAQATSFGSVLECNTIQTLQAAGPPPDFQFVPRDGNSTVVLPPPPANMTTETRGPEYLPDGNSAGEVPAPSKTSAPTLLAAEQPEITITKLDVAEVSEVVLFE